MDSHTATTAVTRDVMYPSRFQRSRGKLTPRFRTSTGIGTMRPASSARVRALPLWQWTTWIPWARISRASAKTAGKSSA